MARISELHLCGRSGSVSSKCYGVCPKKGIKLLRTMPMLRELRLSELSWEDLLATMAECPKLEKLSVRYECLRFTSTAAADSAACQLTSELTRCQLLTELDILEDPVSQFDLFGLLTTCNRLKRLRVSCHNLELSSPTSGAMGPLRQFDLTHLELSIEDPGDAFGRLADLDPSLHHLDVKYFRDAKLTEDGLASGLRQLRNLEVLLLEMDGVFPLRLTSPLLASLSDLSLKSLAFNIDLEAENSASGMAAVFQRCPTLTALRLRGLRRGGGLVDELETMPVVEKEVSLFLPRDAAEELQRMPTRNVRVIEDDYDAWERFIGWPRKIDRCGSLLEEIWEQIGLSLH